MTSRNNAGGCGTQYSFVISRLLCIVDGRYALRNEAMMEVGATTRYRVAYPHTVRVQWSMKIEVA